MHENAQLFSKMYKNLQNLQNLQKYTKMYKNVHNVQNVQNVQKCTEMFKNELKLKLTKMTYNQNKQTYLAT